jgi:alcohol dehydrogenase
MNYHMPTKLIFGQGKISSLGEILGNYPSFKKILIVTDKDLIKTGIVGKVSSQLKNFEIFDGIEQNPKSPTVNKAGQMAREMKPDLIIAVGGGSALDAGKAVALLATNPGKIEDYEGRRKYNVNPLPMIAVPTTCGTGSEVTWVSVITDPERKFKMSVKGPEMYPIFAIVDPDFLLTLPKNLIAATGMDALTHAIEAYTVKPASIITDLFAYKAIELIANSILEAYEDIERNQTARLNLMLGSTIAGFAFGNSDVGAVHCLSESIGAIFDIPHGIANAVFLPLVMDFNRPVCEEKFSNIARIFSIDSPDKSIASSLLIQRIKALSKSLGIPSFAELNIDSGSYQLIAEYSFMNNSNPSNPREAKVEDYLEIIKTA